MLMQPTLWQKWAFNANRATATRAQAGATLRCPGDHPFIRNTWSPSATLPFCLLRPLDIWNNEQCSGFPLRQTMLDRLSHSSSRSFMKNILVRSLLAFFWCGFCGLRETFKVKQRRNNIPSFQILKTWALLDLLISLPLLCISILSIQYIVSHGFHFLVFRDHGVCPLSSRTHSYAQVIRKYQLFFQRFPAFAIHCPTATCAAEAATSRSEPAWAENIL